MTSTPHLQNGVAWSWRFYSLQSVLRRQPNQRSARGHSMRCDTSSRSNLTTGSQHQSGGRPLVPTPPRTILRFIRRRCHMLNLTGPPRTLPAHGFENGAPEALSPPSSKPPAHRCAYRTPVFRRESGNVVLLVRTRWRSFNSRLSVLTVTAYRLARGGAPVGPGPRLPRIRHQPEWDQQHETPHPRHASRGRASWRRNGVLRPPRCLALSHRPPARSALQTIQAMS